MELKLFLYQRVLGQKDRGEGAAPELFDDAEALELLAGRDPLGVSHLTILESQ